MQSEIVPVLIDYHVPFQYPASNINRNPIHPEQNIMFQRASPKLNKTCYSRFYFEVSMEAFSHCGPLDMTNYIRHSRPWNCEILVDFFIPKRLRKRLDLYPPSIRTPSYIHRPPSVPRVFLLFYEIKASHRLSIVDSSLLKFAKKWMTTVLLSSSQYIPTLYSSLFYVHAWKYDKDDIEVFQVGGLQQGSLSDDVWWSGLHNLWGMARFSDVFSDLWKIYDGRPNKNDMWYTDESDEELLMNAFLSCHGSVMETSHIIHGTDEEQIKSIAYAQVFHLIMKNFTYRINSIYVCESPGIPIRRGFYWQRRNGFERFLTVRRYQESKWPAVALLTINSSLLHLGFVACGNHIHSGFPIGHLVKAFDAYVWVFLVGVIFIEAVFMSYFDHNLSIPHIFVRQFQILKAVLEQGEPFPRPVKYRVAVAGFLAAAVVISNSFKSTNIHRMTRMRTRTPFRTLEQLKRNNLQYTLELEKKFL